IRSAETRRPTGDLDATGDFHRTRVHDHKNKKAPAGEGSAEEVAGVRSINTFFGSSAPTLSLPDAVQHGALGMTVDSSLTHCAPWRTADPGPPRARSPWRSRLQHTTPHRFAIARRRRAQTCLWLT